MCPEELYLLTAVNRCGRSVDIKEACTSALPKATRLMRVSTSDHRACRIVKYEVLQVVARDGGTVAW
jgi:hypothetical protein